MTTLFIISTTTLPSTVMPQIGDELLLIADAVALALDHEFTELYSTASLHALSDDLDLRGLTLDAHSTVKACSYDNMVALSILHHQIQSC